ncbi:MAG: hypothetical protein JO135_02415, partial [Candidatus Eremiobacteraeota bacterium]|nr:hypothetical protein [Candidatus Eremiobacteraeota bacterium]
MYRQSPLTYLVILTALALVIFRNIRPQTMNVSRLWTVPVVLLVLAGVSFWATALETPPSMLWLPILAVIIGFAIGIPFGILRGRHSKMRAGEKAG